MQSASASKVSTLQPAASIAAAHAENVNRLRTDALQVPTLEPVIEPRYSEFDDVHSGRPAEIRLPADASADTVRTSFSMRVAARCTN